MNEQQGEAQGPQEGGSGPETTESVVVVADARKLARRNWGVLVAVGVVAIVFGIIVLANIWASVHLVAILAGLFLLYAGVMNFVSAASSERRVGRIITGIVALAAGVALLAWPEESVKTVAVIVGIAFLVWGVVGLIAAFIDRNENWGLTAIFSGLLAIVGVIIIAWPGPTIAILMVLVGINAIVFGAATIAEGLALRRA
jgi:uncharacterized membrane protein HdeD (DUF308 family)